MRRWLSIAVPLAILVLGVGLRAWDPQPLRELRYKVFDTYQRIEPRPYDERLPVAVVDIDDETLERQGQWPWPRTMVAELLERLRELGAIVVAFDMVFAEPDRTSPDILSRTWPDTPEWSKVKQVISEEELPDHDQIFAETIARARTVAGYVLTDGKRNREPPRKAGFATAGDDPLGFVYTYAGAVANLPVLSEAATGAGSLNVLPDSDGIVRRVPLVFSHDGKLYPSLAAEALRVAQGASTYIIKASGAHGVMALGESTGIAQVKIGRFVVPTDARGRIVIRDTGPQRSRRVPAWKILSGELAPQRLAGTIVFIGTSAAGLSDLHTTPLSPNVPGVELHAQVVEQALLQDFLNRPDWASGAELLFLIALSLGVIACFQFPKLGGGWAVGLALAAIAAALWASWYAFSGLHLLFDPVYPGVVGVAIYLVSSLLSYLRSEGERRRVRTAFSRYMAPTLVERLAADPSQLKLGGENRELTLLFADIRGFTGISEHFDAEGLTRFINRFLTPMTDAILACRGTIDKYMGDAIMAFWNAPLDDPEHARNACRAALEMGERLEQLNADLAEEAAARGEFLPPINIGIGLNTGICCVGNLGSEQRFDYSCLGDEVNLASRLEGQSKTYGVPVVMGEHTREAAPEFAAVQLDLLRVKGRTQPARVFALLGGPELAEREDFQELVRQHDEMLASYRSQEWEAALEAIEDCRVHPLAGMLETLYDLYEERIAALRAEPPGPDWDGVHVALTK